MTMRSGRDSIWRTVVASVFVAVAGLAVAHTATTGFRAYTLESARRMAALSAPRPVPDLELQLADGGQARLAKMPARVLLVDFIYTNCPAWCSALGSVYAQLKERLAVEIAAGKVALVSVTFDPARDGPAELAAYRARYSPDPSGWSLGRPAPTDLPAWLRAFGVVVIPDEMGGYVHNAAVHVIGADRRLVAILDLTDIDGIVAAARRLSDEDRSHPAAGNGGAQ
ncbi:MAG: SCO family protein [Burkholderiales bacterium]|nr:SCO family protein [Burkholderiales bacterium]